MHDLNAATKAATILSPAEITPAAAHVADIAQGLGFRVGATIDISSREDLLDEDGGSLHTGVFGWDDPKKRWWDRPQHALTSPIALSCRYESEPFWCNHKGPHGFVSNPELRRISFGRFFDAIPSLNSVLVVPVRLTIGRVGAAALCPIDESKADLSEVFEQSSPLLASVMRRFLSTYASHAQTVAPVPSETRLSRREVQCLYWASRGKTDAETAIILGVSHAAVRYHVTRVAEKLDCVNRAQAIFKASQLGYLASN